MLRLLACEPLQIGTHSDHGVQSVISQSTAQAWRSHSKLCSASPLQFAPSPMRGRSMPLKRCLEEMPQVALQSLHAVHSVQLQSWHTLLQFLSSEATPQGCPPLMAGVTMERVLVCSPAQKGEHSVQSAHSDCTQSVGHG